MINLVFSYRALRALSNIGAIPSAERVSKIIVGGISETNRERIEYNLAPFGDRPIRSLNLRSNGWVRLFSGNLRVEYKTGIIYSGFRPIYGSTDGLYSKNPDIPPTRPADIFGRSYKGIEEAIVLKSLRQNDYYHFLFEFVPKIEIIERADIPLSVPAIVTRDLASQPFFVAAAELGLFGKRPVIIQNENEVIEAKRLYVARADICSERQLRFPSKRLRNRPGIQGRARIYISRNGQTARGRQIINEQELIARLRPLGFSVIDPGTMPLAEQITCFSHASIVVGPHGAGLTNILFRYGAPMALVEMINDTIKWNHHYFEIATHCGYFYRATLNHTEPGDGQTASAYADIGSVLTAVEQAIAWEISAYGDQVPLSDNP